MSEKYIVSFPPSSFNIDASCPAEAAKSALKVLAEGRIVAQCKDVYGSTTNVDIAKELRIDEIIAKIGTKEGMELISGLIAKRIELWKINESIRELIGGEELDGLAEESAKIGMMDDQSDGELVLFVENYLDK